VIVLNLAGQIKGDCTVQGHENWITCDSIQLGVGRSISVSGGGSDRDTSNPSFSEITVTKSTDLASPDLWMQAVAGKSLGKAEVHFIQTAGPEAKGQVYLIYELEDAIISSYSMSSGGERPTESVSINFTKISKQYNQFSGGKITTGTPKKWDLMKNQTY
jgi:type VI secretion system secreted protein Hcp